MEFNPLYPVIVLSQEEAHEKFGDMYKYDFPKWCAENNVQCFYYKSTMLYILIPKEAQAV